MYCTALRTSDPGCDKAEESCQRGIGSFNYNGQPLTLKRLRCMFNPSTMRDRRCEKAHIYRHSSDVSVISSVGSALAAGGMSGKLHAVKHMHVIGQLVILRLLADIWFRDVLRHFN
jgi:hypothetical protein